MGMIESFHKINNRRQKYKMDVNALTMFAEAWQEQQKRIDELENRINGALEAMDAESANSWGIWKEKACMYEQGASSAYEKSYWILKGEQDD